jgi:hypothetical protein
LLTFFPSVLELQSSQSQPPDLLRLQSWATVLSFNADLKCSSILEMGSKCLFPIHISKNLKFYAFRFRKILRIISYIFYLLSFWGILSGKLSFEDRMGIFGVNTSLQFSLWVRVGFSEYLRFIIQRKKLSPLLILYSYSLVLFWTWFLFCIKCLHVINGHA